MSEPRFIPDRITKASPQEMYDALGKAWNEKFGEWPRKASILLLLSQWSIETAEGASMHCWNVGNAKSVPGDGRSWTHFRCWEVIKGKKVWFDPPHPQTRFRAFDTLAEGAADYLAMLHKRFNLSWPAVISGSPEEFAHLLKVQRYYTADEAAYAKAVRLRFDAYNRYVAIYDD